jgi:hypothetical protein
MSDRKEEIDRAMAKVVETQERMGEQLVPKAIGEAVLTVLEYGNGLTLQALVNVLEIAEKSSDRSRADLAQRALKRIRDITDAPGH